MLTRSSKLSHKKNCKRLLKLFKIALMQVQLAKVTEGDTLSFRFRYFMRQGCCSSPASCFVDSTWPKFIGDGQTENSVASIDRCSNNDQANYGNLAVAILTKDETNFYSQLSGKGHGYIFAELNPNDNNGSFPGAGTFTWALIENNVRHGDWDHYPQIKFTPDCSKVLVYYFGIKQSSNAKKNVYMYIAAQGAVAGKVIAASRELSSNPALYKNTMATNRDGSQIFALAIRNNNKFAQLRKIEFNAYSNKFTSRHPQDVQLWDIDDQFTGVQQFSLLYGTPKGQVIEKLFTFSSYKVAAATYHCLLTEWELSSVSVGKSFAPKWSLSYPSDSVSRKQCVLAGFVEKDAGYQILSFMQKEEASQSAELVVYDPSNHSYQRVYVKSTSPGTLKQIQSTSAYFQSATEVYILGYKNVASAKRDDFLFKFEFSSASGDKKLITFPITMFSTGSDQNLIDSLIYGLDNSNGFYPVKGYMVGRTNQMFTHNDKCQQADFGIEIGKRGVFGYYGSVQFEDYGYIDFIEQYDSKSCRRERSNSYSVHTEDLLIEQSSDTDSTNLEVSTSSKIQSYKFQDHELDDFEQLTDTQFKKVYEGHQQSRCWQYSQTTHEFKTSKSPQFVNSASAVKYIIGSGKQTVTFDNNWWGENLQGAICSLGQIEYDYSIRAVFSGSNTQATTLVVDKVLRTSTNIQISSDDKTLHGKEITVSLLMVAANYQCTTFSVQIMPVSCRGANFSQVTWLTNGETSLHIDYPMTDKEQIYEFSSFTTDQDPYCPDVHYKMELQSTSIDLGSAVALDEQARKLVVRASISDTRLVDQTLLLQISISKVSINEFPDTSRATILVLLRFIGPCSFDKMQLKHPYSPIQTMVLSASSKQTLFPTLVSMTQPSLDCEGLQFELEEPIPNKIRGITTIEMNGTVQIGIPPIGSKGNYSLKVKISRAANPENSITTTIIVNIAACIPIKVTAPQLDFPQEINYTIGTPYVLEQLVKPFEIPINCETPLVYTIIDTSTGSEIPSELGVSLSKNADRLRIATRKNSYAGLYDLEIRAEVPELRQISASVFFKLHLLIGEVEQNDPGDRIESQTQSKEELLTVDSHIASSVTKSLIVLEIKTRSEDTDIQAISNKILNIQIEGLIWKPEWKKEPIANGMFKILISATFEDDKVSIGTITKLIRASEDDVESVDSYIVDKWHVEGKCC